MAILTPTKATGATAKPGDAVYVPDAVADRSVFQASQELRGEINVPFLLDLLSAYLAHERCGRHLYRAIAERTNNPILKAKYEEFGAQTERHVEILEGMCSKLGANPAYVSPAARAVEGMDSKLLESTFLLGGSADLMLQETVMLDAVFVAESVDHANWRGMRQIGEQLPEGAMRAAFQSAVDEVEQQEDEHLRWVTETRSRLALVQARSSLAATAGEKAEELIGRVRDWLS